ncbi:MAG TPA: phosphatidylserine decarboxylase [Cyclobacteriaceae bacterium]
MPSRWQRSLSKFYAQLYNNTYSRHIIGPYCRFNYDDTSYLDQFKPASGNSTYQSFQDFFTRVFKKPLLINSETVWPCEGLLCANGKVGETELVNVKGQQRHLRTIFGELGKAIPDDYYFSNVFLHNNNYHRIHSPVTGTVTQIEHIPGDLVVLRPWIYKNDPSLPALRNERINVGIKSRQGEHWFLSIVGGPAVGSILLAQGLSIGSWVFIGEELGTFLLGSTCCIASPVPVSHTSVGGQVSVGDPL